MNKFSQQLEIFLKEQEELANTTTPQVHEWDTLKHPVKDRIVDYWKKWIKENEHQDGEAFWDNFSEPQDAVEDFLRTVEDWNPKI